MLNTTLVGLKGLGTADVHVTSTNPHMFRPCMALIARWLANRDPGSGVGVGAGASSAATSTDTAGQQSDDTSKVRVVVNGLMTPQEAAELAATPGYVFVQTEQWENFTQAFMVPVYRAARAVWCMDMVDYLFMVRSVGIPEDRVAIVPVLLGV
jgi:hypothetical protein